MPDADADDGNDAHHVPAWRTAGRDTSDREYHQTRLTRIYGDALEHGPAVLGLGAPGRR